MLSMSGPLNTDRTSRIGIENTRWSFTVIIHQHLL